MIPHPDFRRQIIAAARKRILYLPHAVRQMARPDRMITTEEVRRVVMRGEIIEDYPDDTRGHSCLLLGSGNARKLHVVCAPKSAYVAIITAYLPEASEWEANFKTRRKR